MTELASVQQHGPTATQVTDGEVAYRLRLIRGDAAEDDLMVALGLIASGAAPCPPEFAASAQAGLADREAVDTVLAAGGSRRELLYDLWYRMKIPFGKGPLDSWYVLTLALGRSGGDVAKAFALHTVVLEECATQSGAAPQILAKHLDVTGDPVPAEDAYDSAALLRAVVSGAPMQLPDRPWRASMRERALADWSALREEERTLLLMELRERIGALEQVRLLIEGELNDNAAVAGTLLGCAATNPYTWSPGSLALATTVWMWREAMVCLQELNQSLLCLPHLFDFAVRRLREYEQVRDHVDGTATAPAPLDLPASPIALAKALGRLRTEVERSHLRCLQFDGGNFERREFLVPRADCDALLPLPDDLRASLQEAFDVSLEGDGPKVWETVLDAAVARGQGPSKVVKLLAQWTADDAVLPVDYAIFTVPIGVKLDAPWTLDYEDIFCYTAFRSGFDPSTDAVPFDFVGICNAIGQRMRYNAVKKAQNYTFVRRFKAQSFNLPDIAIAEDANHAGHRGAGIRQSCRIPTYVHYRGLFWKGISDVRFNRTLYSPKLEFRPSDVPLANRSATWLGWLADAVYARNLTFDVKYGKKLVRETAGAQEGTS